MRKIIVVVTLAAFLSGFTWSVTAKEGQIASGDVVIITLAPRDPRAFLLGDYMALNYAMNQQVEKALYARYTGGKNPRWTRRNSEEALKIPQDGIAIVSLDEKHIASFVRLDDGSPLQNNEHRLFFRVRDGSAKIAASAFYFQEGYAKDFDRAEYGELRVDKNGKSLLVFMLNKNLERIQPQKETKEKS